jgi:hypothetical protein
MLRNHGLRDLIAMLDIFRDRGIRTTIGAAALVACGLSAWQASAALLPTSDGTTVYDIVNNVSWLADANLAATNRFGLPLCTGPGTQTCVNASGSMRYGPAVAWVQSMNAANYLGHSNWQLPTTPPLDSGCGKTGPNGNSFGFGCTASAYAALYNALGFKAPNTAVPIPNYTVGPFSNFQPYLYWSQTSTPPPAGNATFSFATGWQGANTLPNFLYVLPMVQGKLPGTPPTTGNGLQVNPGGQTVYDPVTNITWLANANLAATNTFGLPSCKDPTTPAICAAQDGAMTFASASQFVANMNAFNGAGYLGQTNWQMPPVDPSCPNYNCAGNLNPMGNLFYGQLGFSQGMSVVTAPSIAGGPFKNIQPYLYWTCEGATISGACQTDGPAPNFEWSFSFGSGFEGTDLLANDLYVTAYFVGPPSSLCTESLSSGGQAFTASGGTGSITITTQTGCPWSVGALPAGVSLTSAGSGSGPGTVTFQVFPNTGGDVSTSFTIAGQTFTVEQEAASIPGLTPAGSLGQVTSEGTWDFSLDAINLGTPAATARFTFFDNSGNPLAMPLTFPQSPPAAGPELASTLDRTIGSNAQVVIESTGPDSVTQLVGWGQLLTNGNVSGFGIFSDPRLGWNAVVPLETRNASKYILAFDNTGNLATGVAVANLANAAANVNVIVRDDTGLQIGAPMINLAVLGHTSFMLNQQYLVTVNKRGTIEFDTPSGGQLSVLGLRAYGTAALTTLPVLANVGTGGGSITHATYNGGFTSVFYIVNTGTASASFTLSFFDESGNPLTVPLSLPQTGTPVTTATLTQPLAAGAMLVVQTQSNDAAPSVVGSARLTTTGNISGFEIFHWTTFNQEASVPLETRSPNSFVVVFDDTNGLTTGVALANLANSTANITVNLRDDAGAPLHTATITLQPRGHTSFMLPDPTKGFPITANKRGMAEFVVPTGGQISAIGLRAKADGTLTTIPVLAK